jgi:hypothetical protein
MFGVYHVKKSAASTFNGQRKDRSYSESKLSASLKDLVCPEGFPLPWIVVGRCSVFSG